MQKKRKKKLEKSVGVVALLRSLLVLGLVGLILVGVAFALRAGWRAVTLFRATAATNQQLFVFEQAGFSQSSLPVAVFAQKNSDGVFRFWQVFEEELDGAVQPVLVDISSTDPLVSESALRELRFFLSLHAGQSLPTPVVLRQELDTIIAQEGVQARILKQYQEYAQQGKMLDLASISQDPIQLEISLQTRCAIAVENGTNISGLAARVSSALERHGARVVGVSDAHKDGATKVVLSQEAAQECAEVVALLDALQPVAVVPEVDAAQTHRARADIILYLGSEYTNTLDPGESIAE